MKAILVFLFVFLGSTMALFKNSTSKGAALTAEGTCDAALPFSGSGFDICFFGATGTLPSSLISLTGNTHYAIQDALDLGKCYCLQDCEPSQIVCEDGKTFQAILSILQSAGILEGFSLLGFIAEFIYVLENYNFYCFCPDQISVADACKPVANPEVCKPPTTK